MGSPPMPMVPSKRRHVAHRPSPGRGPKRSASRTSAPRFRARARASGDESTPRAGTPRLARLTTRRPGPHPRSSTGPSTVLEQLPLLGDGGGVPAGPVEDQVLAGVGAQDQGRRRPEAGDGGVPLGRPGGRRGGRGGRRWTSGHPPGGSGEAEPRRAAMRAVRVSGPAATTSAKVVEACRGRRGSGGGRRRGRGRGDGPPGPGRCGRCSWAGPGTRPASGRRRPMAHHPPSAAWPRAADDVSSVPRAWSRSAAVTWGVSIPICTPGPPAAAQAWARRRLRLPWHWGIDLEAGGQPRPGRAVEGENPPAGTAGGDRFQGVGQRRLGQGGRLGRGARRAQPGLDPARYG